MKCEKFTENTPLSRQSHAYLFCMKKIKKIIAVMAGKGGVGKSALSVCLAHSFVQKGLKVGLLDADIYGPSLVQMLGAELVISSAEQRVIPAMAHGISLMSMAFFNKKSASFVRAPIANQMILYFIDSVDWGELDLLILDLPPGTGDIQLTLMQQLTIDGAILVTLPQTVSGIDVEKAAQMAEMMQVPLLGVVENMALFYDWSTGRLLDLFSGNSGSFLSQKFNCPLLATLPFDPKIAQSLDEAKNPLQGQSPFISAIEEISLFIEATVLQEQVEKTGHKWSHDSEGIEIFPLEGEKIYFSVAQLQKKCPCTRCASKKEEIEGASLQKVVASGRFGLRFVFSKGCNRGIYPWELLLGAGL